MCENSSKLGLFLVLAGPQEGSGIATGSGAALQVLSAQHPFCWRLTVHPASATHLYLRDGKMSQWSSKSSQPLASRQEKKGTER